MAIRPKKELITKVRDYRDKKYSTNEMAKVLKISPDKVVSLLGDIAREDAANEPWNRLKHKEVNARSFNRIHHSALDKCDKLFEIGEFKAAAEFLKQAIAALKECATIQESYVQVKNHNHTVNLSLPMNQNAIDTYIAEVAPLTAIEADDDIIDLEPEREDETTQ